MLHIEVLLRPQGSLSIFSSFNRKSRCPIASLRFSPMVQHGFFQLTDRRSCPASLALSGCTLVLLTLTIVQRIIPATTIRQVEIQYDHRVETTGYIKAFFAAHSVDVLNVDFHSENSKNERAYTSIYTVRMSARVNLVDLFGPLSEYEHVRAFRIRQPQ